MKLLALPGQMFVFLIIHNFNAMAAVILIAISIERGLLHSCMD